MCDSPKPVQLKEGVVVVSCRKCEKCQQNRYRHWVGRALAEAETSKAVWFMTFTYAGGYDNQAAYVLQYSDLQKTFKRMRKAGHVFRYIAIGEYGDEKKRAHWHALIYWITPPPPNIVMDERIQFEFWNHGFTQCELPRSQQASVSYIVKYINKNEKSLNNLKFSKNPAMGQEYLLSYARKHAEEGLALFRDGPRYTIPGNAGRNGLFWYTVKPTSPVYDKMLREYVRTWARLRFKQKIPHSDIVFEYIENIAENKSTHDFVLDSYIDRHYGMHHVLPEDIKLEAVSDLIDGVPWTITRHNNHGLAEYQCETLWPDGQIRGKIQIWPEGKHDARSLVQKHPLHRRLVALNKPKEKTRPPIVGVNCYSHRSRSKEQSKQENPSLIRPEQKQHGPP